jgi:hypothetical protein
LKIKISTNLNRRPLALLIKGIIFIIRGIFNFFQQDGFLELFWIMELLSFIFGSLNYVAPIVGNSLSYWASILKAHLYFWGGLIAFGLIIVALAGLCILFQKHIQPKLEDIWSNISDWADKHSQ